MALLAAALVLMVVWGAVETRVPEPMVDMRMLARRPVWLIFGPVPARLGRRWGWKAPLVAGMGLVALGILGLALFHEEPWQIVLANIVLGAGLPMTFAAMATLIVTNVRPTETGDRDEHGHADDRRRRRRSSWRRPS